MQNDKAKFKTELKKRIYYWILRLIRFIDTLPHNTSVKIIASQLIDSGTGIGANYVEAQTGSSKRDFRNKIYICKKEANETKY